MRARGSGSSAASGIYPGTPQVADLFALSNTNIDTDTWFHVTVDARVRSNAYVENVPAAVNNYLAMMFTLGPKGSLWAIRASYAAAPDGGQIGAYLASVPEPDPARAGVDDAGTLLRSDDVTYVSWGSIGDTYAPVFVDTEFGGQHVVRLTGDDHAPMTQIGATTDPWTGYRETDGGAGVYRLKLAVTGKNAASTGYKGRLTALALVRLDDNGFI